MAVKIRDAEFRHPEAAAFLESLTDEQAAKQPPLILEQDGVVARQRREGGRVRCREVAAEASAGSSSEMQAAAAFGRSLPQLKAELRVGGVPDLDAIETLVRAEMLNCGAKGCAALPEAVDAELPPPSCPSCGRRMERHGRVGKTLKTRLGPVRIERTYWRCRACGGGRFPLDRLLDLEGRSVAPGAESLYADATRSDSYEEAVRKLKNLAGVEVSKATLRRHVAGVGEEMQAFEREDAGAEAPAAERVLLEIDGTGVPMAAREQRASSVGARSSAPACGSSGSGTACSRPRRWRCCPTERRGSEPPARRFSPDGKRSSSSTCSTP